MKREDFFKKMEENGIDVDKKLTNMDYTETLIKLENLLKSEIIEDSFAEVADMEDIISVLKKKAWKKGMLYDRTYKIGISAMKELSKQEKISISGKKGEERVNRNLEYITRTDASVFKNVYVSGYKDESELDNVILTRNGIIVLEVKNVRYNVIIDEDGRLVRDNGECSEKDPLCKKMALKRRLIRNNIEEKLTEAGIEMPVYVDSYIVFSVPGSKRINVENRIPKEKYCFSSGVGRRIDTYCSWHEYTDEQLEVLRNIIGGLESNKKIFDAGIDLKSMVSKIADMLEAVTKDTVKINIQETTAA